LDWHGIRPAAIAQGGEGGEVIYFYGLSQKINI
jgi:hypothetical protein